MSNTKTYEKRADNKNGMKRLVFTGISAIFELLILFMMFTRFFAIAEWIRVATGLLGVVLVIYIYGQHKTSSMKMPWIILILAFPTFGVFTYLLIGLNGSTRKMNKAIKEMDEQLYKYLPSNTDVMESLRMKSAEGYNVASYINNYGHYPLYGNTDVVYYKTPKEGLKAQLEELAKAKKFIFMEYHAIEDDIAWSFIEDILIDRVNAGVDVRVFYDDMGSIGFVNTGFVKKLEKRGIKCQDFNTFSMVFNILLNNRDHRKITVIDGRVGFTGGYNLANEYFEITNPYGAWKDSGIKITGDAVRSLTVMFLEMWNFKKGRRDKFYKDDNFDIFFEENDYTAAGKGYVQPYADSPVDDERVGEEVYISLINKSEKYCYFMTPYLIITDEMTHALSLAAKRGVDVKIITPGVPDKKIVYSVTRSFYNGLVRNGVRIYEWQPGFVHAKMCISDDAVAAVGTINLDYRSLYHHFENGCILYNVAAVADIKADFDSTFAECNDVTEEYLTGRSRFRRFGQMFLRLFAELL